YLAPTAKPRKEDRKGCQCHQPERQVDIEDPAPTEMVGDESADERADDAAQAKDTHDQAHPSSPLPRGENIADGRAPSAIMAPPPMPVTARAAISSLMFCEMPDTAEPSRNNTRPAI